MAPDKTNNQQLPTVRAGKAQGCGGVWQRSKGQPGLLAAQCVLCHLGNQMGGWVYASNKPCDRRTALHALPLVSWLCYLVCCFRLAKVHCVLLCAAYQAARPSISVLLRLFSGCMTASPGYQHDALQHLGRCVLASDVGHTVALCVLEGCATAWLFLWHGLWHCQRSKAWCTCCWLEASSAAALDAVSVYLSSCCQMHAVLCYRCLGVLDSSTHRGRRAGLFGCTGIVVHCNV